MMTKSALLLSALLAACATTGANTTTAMLDEPGTGRVQLDLAPHADVDRVFPSAVDPRLPGADRMATQILTEVGDRASLDVRLCVAPEGRVSSIEVLRGSGMAALDRSVVADAMAWQFASLPGPASVKTCEAATITYHPRG